MKSDAPGRRDRARTYSLARAVGRRIQALRQERGWPPRHLAALLGCATGQVEEYEAGLLLPGVRTLMMLSEAFRVSVDSLLFEDPEAPAALADQELLRCFRQIGLMGPADRRAAVDLLGIFLSLHDLLHGRAPRRGNGPVPPAEPAPTLLRLDRLAEEERQAAQAFLGIVVALRRLRSRPTPDKAGEREPPPFGGTNDGSP